MPISIDANIEQMNSEIALRGFSVIANFIPEEEVVILRTEAQRLQQAGLMQRALTAPQLTPDAGDIRGDFIHWLDSASITTAQQGYLHIMDKLRSRINQSLYLGLFELESHFAIYPPGAIYRKHLDQFQGNPRRQVSCILYLNEPWRHEDGGQLRLYLDDKARATPHLDIEPIGGTMVAFLSGRFLHEVLPAKRERISLTGWFRTRPDSSAN